MSKYKSEEDGITHINVYSKGRTKLGKFLSNFTKCRIETEDGVFWSIEGYWYWLGCSHERKEELRFVNGARAKKLGRDLGADDWLEEDKFKEKIKKAIDIKLNKRRSFLLQLKKSDLPLAHYYEYGGKIVEVPKADWIIEYLESYRNEK